MTEEQWLRDTLEAAVPEPPATDRLGGVRARRRRTTTRRAVLAASSASLAVVAVAAPIVVGRSADPRPASDPAHLGTACDDASSLPMPPSTLSSDTVVDGVLCPTSHAAGVTVDSQDLATLVADYDRREPHLTFEYCSPTWTFVVRTSGGARFRISGDCSYVGDDGGRYSIGPEGHLALTHLFAEVTGR